MSDIVQSLRYGHYSPVTRNLSHNADKECPECNALMAEAADTIEIMAREIADLKAAYEGCCKERFRLDEELEHVKKVRQP